MSKIKLEITGASIRSSTWNGVPAYPAFNYNIESKYLQWELKNGHCSRILLDHADKTDFDCLVEMFNVLSPDAIKSDEEVDRLIVQSFQVYD